MGHRGKRSKESIEKRINESYNRFHDKERREVIATKLTSGHRRVTKERGGNRRVLFTDFMPLAQPGDVLYTSHRNGLYDNVEVDFSALFYTMK